MDLPLIADLSPIAQLFVLAFLFSIVFGIVAKSTDFCPLGGIADIMQTGNSGRLRMYFFAIATAILGITALEWLQMLDLDNTRPPYRMSQFRWPGYVLGGLLFGIGMTLCRGCGMKNMINLGSGNLKAVIAILGMGGAAVVMLYVEGFFQSYFLDWMMPLTPDLAEQGMDHQDLGTIATQLAAAEPAEGMLGQMRLYIGAGLGGLLVLLVFSSRDFRARFANIAGGLLIGSMIVGAYWLSGGPVGEAANEASEFLDQPQNGMGMQSYTFIRPMGDLLYVIANPLGYLVTFGLVAFLGVGAGSLIISLLSGRFIFQWFSSLGEAVRYLIGGLMVGIGGILGMGCTLGQGIAGTSTLALGSFVNLFSLIIGAYVGIKLQKRFMDDHVTPGCD